MQSVEIHTAGNAVAVAVGTIPYYAVVSGRFRVIDQRHHFPPKTLSTSASTCSGTDSRRLHGSGGPIELPLTRNDASRRSAIGSSPPSPPARRKPNDSAVDYPSVKASQSSHFAMIFTSLLTLQSTSTRAEVNQRLRRGQGVSVALVCSMVRPVQCILAVHHRRSELLKNCTVLSIELPSNRLQGPPDVVYFRYRGCPTLSLFGMAVAQDR